MSKKTWGRIALVGVAAILSVGLASAKARKDDQSGFFLFVSGALDTPQNTDEVIATFQGDQAASPQTQGTIRTNWSSDFAYKLGFGYKWQGGQSLSVSYWRFDSDQRTRGDGPTDGFLNFAIGPATYYSGYGYFGQFGSPGHFDFDSKLKAETLDVTWGRDHEITENFVLGWSLGLRYAKFQERMTGTYDFYDTASGYLGYYTYGAAKKNKSTMMGFKVGTRVTRNFGEVIAVTAGLGFSMLQGKVESTSGLTPIGSVNSTFLTPTFASARDKDRGGLIRDFDVGVYFKFAKDHVRLKVGWEQNSWDGLPTDLLRNNVASLVALDERKNVTFSGWTLGVGVRF